jgi:uncharacterized membrane protein YidH (DUF202 family)
LNERFSDRPHKWRATAADALAVDRTHLDTSMLSWVRTATALITFGFSIQQFFRIAKGESPEKTGLSGRMNLGWR